MPGGEGLRNGGPRRRHPTCCGIRGKRPSQAHFPQVTVAVWPEIGQNGSDNPATPVRLTRETDYALRGLRALARRAQGDTIPVHEIAEVEGLPLSFLAKIFQKLTQHGILRSQRGAGQGYELAASPKAISLLQVVEAIQGSGYLDQCVFWSGRCGTDNPCLLHERWRQIKPRVVALLEGTTLADLAGDEEVLAADGTAG